jgi:hypothetical protein
MAGRRNTAASEKNPRPRAYEICLQRACTEVRALKDLLQAELELGKGSRQRSVTNEERRKGCPLTRRVLSKVAAQVENLKQELERTG